MSKYTLESAASLSDEDFLNELGNPSFLTSEEEEMENEGDTEEPEELKEVEEEPEDVEPLDDEGEEAEGAEDEGTNEGEEAEEEEEEDTTEDNKSSKASTDAEAFYKAITAPFKANNRTIQVKSPEEAIKLMQMGAGYTKRMTELKPTLQIVKTLANAELLDPSKINHIVDLMRGDKAAIMKLMHDTKFDINEVEDLDEQSKDYRASNSIASMEAVELDEVIASHSGDSDFNHILEDVQKWDNQALVMVGKDPNVLSRLAEHKKLGVYSTVTDELARLQALNDSSISGLNSLDAYIKVGGMLQAQGVFDDLDKPTDKSKANTQAIKDAVKDAVNKRKPKKVAQDKSKAANVSSRPLRQAKLPSDEDLAKLSDEDFLKQLGL